MNPKLLNTSLTFALMMLLVDVANAACETQAKTSNVKVSVYDSVPKFYTQQGWVLGKKVKDLPENSEIWICSRQWVGFLFRKKLWLQIAEEKDTSPVGWIPGESIQNGNVTANRTQLLNASLSLQANRSAKNLQDANTASPGFGPDLGVVRALLFFTMILGMVAKETYDGILASQWNFKSCLKQSLPAFVISPIVFLSMLRTNLQIPSDGGFLVLFFWAFQNGFFWQTVVKIPPRDRVKQATAA